MLWEVPKTSGTKNPDIPRILDLRPDLVFANQEERLEDANPSKGPIRDVKNRARAGRILSGLASRYRPPSSLTSRTPL